MRLRQHVEVLADDAFQGREAGGPADRKTTNYIAKALANAGIEPGWRGKWLQPAPFIRRSAVEWRLSGQASGEAIEISPEALVLIGEGKVERIANAPVVFIGHGIVDPASGRDDIGSADLKGAVALRFAEPPPEYAAGNRPVPDLRLRRALYRSRGAVADIAINDSEDAEFARLQRGYRLGLMRLEETGPGIGVTGHVKAAAAAPVLAAAGLDLKTMRTQAAMPDFRAATIPLRITAHVETGIRRFRSANVVGRLEGRGRPDEAVIVTAHWDGYGVCLPAGSPDRICNGAIDNASGIAGMIELARALKAGPAPRRSVLFVATTAEEHGLLGAEYYAAHPAVPLRATVGGVNLDTIALRGRGAKLGVIGRGLTTLDPIIRDVATAQGRELLDDSSVQQYFRRSDHFALVKRGVPMVMLTGIFSREREKDDAIDRYFERDYHQPGDELEAVPSFDGAAEDVEAALAVVRWMANADVPPRWLPNSPYQRGGGPSAP